MDMNNIKPVAQFKGRSVLIVEDEKTTCKILELVLTKLGFDTVKITSDGSEALKCLDAARFDVILCDIQMKPMNGIEFLQTLRSSSSLRFDAAKSATPVILLTASTDMDHVRAAKGSGVQGYLLKPVNAEAIRDRLMATIHD